MIVMCIDVLEQLQYTDAHNYAIWLVVFRVSIPKCDTHTYILVSLQLWSPKIHWLINRPQINQCVAN